MTRSRRDPLPGNRLAKAILSLQPTAYWPLDDGNGPLRSLAQNWPATVTGSPTYGAAAPSPIGRGVTWSGSSQSASTSSSLPTPTASISVLALFNTATTGANNFMVSRQNSWDLRIHSSGQNLFLAYQAGGASHATASGGGSYTDGRWHLVIGTFDGTTIGVGTDTRATGTSTSLTGSWQKSPGTSVNISLLPGSAWFTGALAHVAIFNDRILTLGERLYLYSVVFGG